MKKTLHFLFLLLGALLVSCSFEDEPKDQVDKIIPDYILKEIEAQMPIHRGENPPVIEGVYYADPYVLMYNSDKESSFQAGKKFTSVYIKFSNQDAKANKLDYRKISRTGTSKDVGIGSFISGEGNDFTVVFKTKGYADGIPNTKASVISGTVCDEGIRDLVIAIAMLEKDDPNNDLMEIGTFRVIRDDDGLAEFGIWPDNSELPDQLDEFIPKDILDDMISHGLPIYEGNHPPRIEGVYAQNQVAVYNTDNHVYPGETIMSYNLKFQKQDVQKNRIGSESYCVPEPSDYNISMNSPIQGSGNNFTCFMETTGYQDGVFLRKARIISGTLVEEGIKDMYEAFLFLEVGPDPHNQNDAEVGNYRIYKEADGICEFTDWTRSTRSEVPVETEELPEAESR